MNQTKTKIKQPGWSAGAKKVLCIGEVLWDLLPTGAKVGGAPLNVAMHLNRFGINSSFAGRIGNDDKGRELMDFIKSHELSTSLIQTDMEKPTSTVKVELRSDNSVKFEIVDDVAWDRIELTETLQKAAWEADVIVYGTLASRHKFTRETLIKILGYKGLKLIDVNLRPPFIEKEVVETLLTISDIAKLNDDELRLLGNWNGKNYDEKGLAEWFCEKYGCRLLCVTRGEKGAFLYEKNNYFDHPGFKVKVRDTVGAGDAFLAGFLAKYLNQASPEEALGFACATGALIASKEGAIPDYNPDEVIEILQRTIQQ